MLGMTLAPHILAATKAASEGGVAYWAHIGGFTCGFLIAGIYKLVKPNSEVVCEMPEDNCKPEDKSSNGKK